ncbi:hypothetical protein MC378_05360 [Polaribacter sp. MSW13]|uniref:Uncharacterized protein n=1 Tax=Polaribacter marinus TaxID=2916838 RepID=A0A9X1VS98_9FLAO|nr:hypothetical protein [Polaribacter marinus]MCI2228586.1 hypothetical protein [Polaribacter marinus]
MTDTLIAIISIFVGMMGANFLGVFKKKFSLQFIGNTITGIFGSIFFIKMFSRLGFDPMTIMKTGSLNVVLFSINMLVSFLGGVLGLIFAKWLITKMNK